MKYTECDCCLEIVEPKSFFKDNTGWCFWCPKCGALNNRLDIVDFLLPLGTKVRLDSGDYGVISAYMHEQALTTDEIRYRIILKENGIATLTRSHFDVVSDWRLTQRIPGGIVRVCHYPRNQEYSNVPCYNCVDRAKCNADILNRLAQYEDTGLRPEEIVVLKQKNK